ncbi:hypothetical protein AOC36_09740 [Erysipelothrix larvae]|uniref:HTH lysR-type domain-containing protein n=1 Tax=Erysipelothrix larvae TaxID=1514105 RepID=A0A0X8H1B2_9FIRM|nr:LysR family transcriptional regulator [Erysipelothrix larvae]AMC94253.1 hypothetical protein AOC36_09740 [Erysipelothrix larvae]
MNYSQLQYFLTLSETLHFTHAAQLLYISQPSLSVAISNLEEELGVPLFERSGRHVVLTEYGKVFGAYVSKSMHELQQGIQHLNIMKEKMSETLRIGFLYSLSSQFIPEIVAGYKKGAPKIHFDLFESDTATAECTIELLDGLKHGRFDLVFINRILRDDKDLKFIKVFEQNYVAVVCETSLLSQNQSIDLNDTIGIPLIQYKRKFGTKAEINSLFESIGCPFEVGAELEDESSIINYVKRDLGFAILPYSENLEQPGVTVLEIHNPQFVRSIYVGYNKIKHENVTVKHFIDWICNHLSV